MLPTCECSCEPGVSKLPLAECFPGICHGSTDGSGFLLGSRAGFSSTWPLRPALGHFAQYSAITPLPRLLGSHSVQLRLGGGRRDTETSGAGDSDTLEDEIRESPQANASPLYGVILDRGEVGRGR